MDEPRGKVLIVEDDDKLQGILAQLVAAKGFEVVSVSTGEAALEQLEQSTFDLMTLDLRLPDMPGTKILRALSTLVADTQVIIITGYASLESAIEAVRLGAADYLIKPFGIERLDRALEGAMKKLRLKEGVDEKRASAPEKPSKQGRRSWLLDEQFQVIAGTWAEKEEEENLASIAAALGMPLEELKHTLERVKQGEAVPGTDFSLPGCKARITCLNTADRRRLFLLYSDKGEALPALADGQALKLARHGQLAAMLVHDIAGPLGILTGYIDLLKEMQLEDPLLKRYIGKLEHETDRASGILKEFRAYFSGLKLDLRPVEASTWVEEIKTDLEQLAAQNSGRIEWDVAPGIVWADPEALGRVVFNLVKNAFEAGTGPVTVRVTLAPRGDRFLLAVEDDGPGIPANVRETLFDPFVSSKPSGPHLGLGLAIVKEVVDDSGGEIRVLSREPSGTRFELLFQSAKTPAMVSSDE